MTLPRKIRLVLSGGGTSGVLAHTGAVLELQRRGYQVKAVGGVSAGAIVAACIASGVDVERVVVDLLTGGELGDRDLNVWPFPSAYDGEEILRALMRHLPSVMGDAAIPLHIVTANIVTHHQMIWASTVHKRWSMAKIVRASMSIPGAFQPVKLGDYLHVDGGLCSNAPVDDIFGDHDDVVLLKISRRGSESSPGNPWEYIGALVNTAIQSNEDEDAADAVKAHVIPVWATGPTLDFGMTRSAAEAQVRLGVQSVADWLESRPMEA